MRFKKTFIVFLIALILLNVSVAFATNRNNNNISNFFRIHIVANSDSIDDQLLKYQVAKELDKYVLSLTANCNSKEQSKQAIEINMQNILNTCNNVITEQGYNYALKAYIGKLEYDEKQNDNIYMSAGIYDSLKVVIGDGNGNNWWSLIYPSTLNNLENLENNNVEYRLYIVDWFKELFNI